MAAVFPATALTAIAAAQFGTVAIFCIFMLQMARLQMEYLFTVALFSILCTAIRCNLFRAKNAGLSV